MSFEEKMKRLEEIVQTLENGECSLNDAVSLFSEGLSLSKECKNELDSARQKIEYIEPESEPETDND